MYSESDLQSAVEAGVVSQTMADALRNHVATIHASPVVDEEHFRLLTGFNDIFVSIAGIILLVSLGWLGARGPGGDPSPLAGILVAAASWGLAEYFTRIRRMALPSIVLLLGYAGGVGFALAALFLNALPDLPERGQALVMSLVALLTACATWFHWRRFMVPITIAAGAASAAGVVIALIVAAIPGIEDGIFWFILATGFAMFAFAMHWDMSDRARTTRRSDVAFWLHLVAAPMIAHSMFHLLGVFRHDMGIGTAVTVLALYVAFGLVALAIDRRALLVSSLAYVLYAMYALFEQAGALEFSAAFTALVIGSALLLLSALWHRARRLVVEGLPAEMQARLPYVDRLPA